MSVHLTDPKEYEGGELNLINYSNYPIMVNNNLGSTIVFDSRIPHKVFNYMGNKDCFGRLGES